MNLKKAEKIVVMKSTLRFLRICRIFPKDEDLDKSDKQRTMSIIMLLVCAYFPFGILLQIITNMKYGGNYYLDKEIMILLSYSGTAYFTTLYVFHMKEFINICRQLSDFETFGKPTEFDQTNKMLNKGSLYQFTYHITVVCIISLTDLVNIRQCIEDNKGREVHQVCGMVGRMWLPFNYDYFPVKQIVFAYQLFCSFVSYHGAGLVSYAILEAVEHMNIRFRHLFNTLVEVLKIEDQTERRKQFNKTVQYHYSLIEMGTIMNDSFRGCCMAHVTLTAPVLGICGYRLLSGTPIDAAVLLLSWSISTSLACSGGQRLQDSSEILSEVLYQTEWYDLEDELKKDLILVILRARKAICLHAGPFGKLTNVMMLAFGKAAYSYVTLLNQTM